jgi:hypothetical protein
MNKKFKKKTFENMDLGKRKTNAPAPICSGK